MFKLDNFRVILFVSFIYTLQCLFYENLKNWCKNRFFRKKFKKVCVLQRRACNKFKCNYLENYNDSEHAAKIKNAPFFMIFLNISFFHMIVNYWTGPLNRVIFWGASYEFCQFLTNRWFIILASGFFSLLSKSVSKVRKF